MTSAIVAIVVELTRAIDAIVVELTRAIVAIVVDIYNTSHDSPKYVPYTTILSKQRNIAITQIICSTWTESIYIF